MLVWLRSVAHNAPLDQRRRDSRMGYVDPAQADAQQDVYRADPCAEALGIPIGMVMSHVSGGRVALRVLLDGQGRPDPVHTRRRAIGP